MEGTYQIKRVAKDDNKPPSSSACKAQCPSIHTKKAPYDRPQHRSINRCAEGAKTTHYVRSGSRPVVIRKSFQGRAGTSPNSRHLTLLNPQKTNRAPVERTAAPGRTSEGSVMAERRPEAEIKPTEGDSGPLSPPVTPHPLPERLWRRRSASPPFPSLSPRNADSLKNTESHTCPLTLRHA